MKRGRMQCKDIPTDDVLRFLAQHQGQWSTWWTPAERCDTYESEPGEP